MTSEVDIIKEISGLLDRNGIAYMFTGSIAANFYTVPRMTRDIDKNYLKRWANYLGIEEIYQKVKG